MNIKILYSVPSDYPELWKRWTQRFRGRGSVKRVKVLRVADKTIVAAFVVLYALLLLGCISVSPGACIGYVVSTALCLGFISLLRRICNAPRPYEMFSLKPLVPKEKREVGCSYPSRHAFCAFLIATMAAIVFHSVASLFVVFLAVALGVMRVLEGVHFPRDVFMGCVLGCIAGGFCLAAVLVTAF